MLISLLLAAVLACQTAQAAYVTVTVDGQELPGEVLAREGVTYVPLIRLLDAMGGWEAEWNQKERTASADTGLDRKSTRLNSSHMA